MNYISPSTVDRASLVNAHTRINQRNRCCGRCRRLPSRGVRGTSLTLPRWQRKHTKRCPYTTGREYAFLQQTLNGNAPPNAASRHRVTSTSGNHSPKPKQIRSAGLLWLHTRYTTPRESSVPKQRLRATIAGGACYVDQAGGERSMCKRSSIGHRGLRCRELHTRGQRGYLWLKVELPIVSSLKC